MTFDLKRLLGESRVPSPPAVLPGGDADVAAEVLDDASPGRDGGAVAASRRASCTLRMKR